MPLPDLTHLQFALMEALGAKERPGRIIRQKLAEEHGIKKSLASFYMAMKRMKEAGFVTVRNEVVEVDGYTAKECHYTLTGHGAKAWRSTLDWYTARQGAQGRKINV